MFQPAQLAQPTSTTCVDTTASDVANRASVDGWKLNPLAIRRQTGVKSGGITYGQAAAAVKTLTKGQITLEPRFGLSIAQVRDLAIAGRPFGISIDCSVTIHTSRHTGTFTGGHTIYVQQWRRTLTGGCACELKLSAPHGEFKIEDPGTFTAGYLWWSESLVNRAAISRGGGAINVLVGQDTEGVSRICQTTSATIRARATKDSTSKGRLPLGARVTVISTTNGADWDRDTDVGTGNGWHYIAWAKSATLTVKGFVRGEALR